MRKRNFALLKALICLPLPLLLLCSCSSSGGKSGFILDGKEYVLYKSGKAVKKYRKLASAKPSPKVLYFQEDHLARCYYLISPNEKGTQKSLQCIKKK